MMQRRKTIEVNGEQITVKELTIGQIRDFMDDIDQQATGIIDMLFPDSLPGAALSMSCDMPVEDLENNFTATELKQIIDASESLNLFFVNMMNTLARAGRQVIKDKILTPSAAD